MNKKFLVILLSLLLVFGCAGLKTPERINYNKTFAKAGLDTDVDANDALDIVYGGTNSALVDPGADKILFWDDGAALGSNFTWLSLGTGLSITGTTLNNDLTYAFKYTSVDYSDDFDAAVLDIGATPTTLFVDSDSAMSTNVTCPATLTVIVLNGGSIDMGGNTLTFNGGLYMMGGDFTHDATMAINGVFRADRYDLGFDSSFTLTFAVGSLDEDGAKPEWWGPNTVAGTTDMYQELTAAFASLPASGGKVSLAGETYGKSDALDINSYDELVGVSSKTTVLINTVANKNGLDIAAGAERVKVHDLRIRAKSGDTTSIGINVDTTSGMTESILENLQISEFQYGIYGQDEFWENTIRNIRIDNSVTDSMNFIGGDGTSTNNLLERIYSQNPGQYGFYFSDSMRNSQIIGCTFGTGVDSALKLYGVRGLSILGGEIESFTLEDGESLIDLDGDTTGTISGMMFISNTGPTGGDYASIIEANNAAVDVSVIGAIEYGTSNNFYSIKANAGNVYYHGGTWESSPANPANSNGQIANTDGVLIAKSDIIDLSGATATEMVIYPPYRYGYLHKATLVYTEATSADAGITLELGYPSDTDFLASKVTSSSLSQYDVENMTINDRRIGGYAGPIILTSPGGKTGTGNCFVVLEYSIIDK